MGMVETTVEMAVAARRLPDVWPSRARHRAGTHMDIIDGATTRGRIAALDRLQSLLAALVTLVNGKIREAWE